MKGKCERALKRKCAQAVQRATPLRSRFPFSLKFCSGVCLSGGAKRRHLS